jgi:SpoVK/Ycf46/Vps4 family AAA+-type ATPase
MANAEQMKALLHSHAERDDGRFYAVAMQVAASEAGKGNRVLADEIRQMIDRLRAKAERSAPLVPIASPSGEFEGLMTMSSPQLRCSDMVLTEAVEKSLSRILNEQKHLARIRSHGLEPRRKLLLSGPPGCGKTMTASALAGELGVPLFTVRLDAVITKFLGETASKLRAVFDAIEKNRAVYLFDEFDAIGSRRGMAHDVGEMRRIVNSFLMLIESSRSNSIVVAATNDAAALDTALFRRFDVLLELPHPGKDLIIAAYRANLANVKKERIAYTRLAELSEGLSFAEIRKVCDEAIKEMLLTGASSLGTQRLIDALEERRSYLTDHTKTD